MLSPKAAKWVTTSRGGVVTDTLNVHMLVRWMESVAVHVTVFVPTGKSDPLTGVHVAVTGGDPPTLFGAP
jgi:hypothetical protein